jgi:hypothetical protein
MSNFEQPADVDALDAAFPASVKHLMPPFSEIREWDMAAKWSNRLFNDWFFWGIESTDGLVPKEGIEKPKALRHIRTVMSSFDPKHEHKEAACAFLFDKWFDGVKSTWTRKAS